MGPPAAESNGRSPDTESLYREHAGTVAALCRCLLRDRADAEDAAQQVFLSAHRALLNGAVPREPRAWLLAVARNECYARFRQRAAAPAPTADAPDGLAADASAHVLRAGELADVWDEVERMPSAQREAFLLREIRGLSYGQLADELSLSRPSVRSLLLRARTRIRRRLGDVAAGLGGAPWVQGLLRLVAGGDGTSPVPAATKAAAVGLGAFVLVSGADVPRAVHRVTTPPKHRRAAAHVHRSATAPLTVAPPQDRPRVEEGRSPAASRDGDRSVHLRSGRSRSHEARGRSSGASQSGEPVESGDDHGSDVTATAAPVAQTTESGGRHDGDGRTSGSTSGSDGGSGSNTTTTTSSGPGDSGSSGSSGSGSSDTSDGGDSHGGGTDGGRGG